MDLCIDIGNSTVKIAIFSGGTLIDKNSLPALKMADIDLLETKHQSIENVILCSVRPYDPVLTARLERSFGRVIVFDEKTPVPVVNMYETPETLGKDRLAGIVGANNIYPAKNVLVVDAGTAMTFDLIDEHSQYLGGNISPGLNMRLRALHEFTGKLPLVSAKQEVQLLARNTHDAIASGVLNGMVFEIDSYIMALKQTLGDLTVLLTGGDAIFFDKKLKSTIFVDPDLILQGLNRILSYNVENK
jgi:type III pantothenate kinase